jgi:hypothetical protein
VETYKEESDNEDITELMESNEHDDSSDEE